MPDLKEAFELFHLKDGVTFDAVKRAYRKFAKASHPDLQQSAEGKIMAEAYIKRVNTSFETLEHHFRDLHRSQAECHCLPPAPQARSIALMDENTIRNQKPVAYECRTDNFYSYQTERSSPGFSNSSVGRAAAQNIKENECSEHWQPTAEEQRWRGQQDTDRTMQDAARNVFMDSLRRRRLGQH